MNWFDPNRISQLTNMAQTATNMAQTASQVFNTVQQMRQQATGEGGPQLVMQQSQRMLTTFQEPTIGGSSHQNLFDGFSREFLKRVVGEGGNHGKQLLEERRADRDGCTPLLCAVRRNDLDAALLLLAYGASPHSADANGDTPLHYAIMAGSVRIVKLLLAFGADPDRQNAAGHSANSLKIRNADLAKVMAQVRKWRQHQQSDSSASSKSKLDPAMHIAEVQQVRSLKHQAGKSRAQKAHALRLLSLDGGGIRGLVLIQMLMELEQLVDGPHQQRARASGNFVQRHFDWIAGTSTGAILALALSDGTPLDDCLRLYLRLKDEIFGPEAKASRISVGYKAECIERFLREQFGERRKMADLRCNKMKVLVTATKAACIPMELVMLRNYASPFTACAQYAPDKMHIWRAARYSSAAPTYFVSMDGLMDGGLMANNPGLPLLREVYNHNKAAEFNLSNHGEAAPQEIGFMLSLGTGKIPKSEVQCADLVVESSVSALMQTISALTNLKSMLVEQLATSDGEVVEVARMACHSQLVPYFRLTPQLEVDIPLDTVDNGTLVDMMWEAKVHVREHNAADVQSLMTMMREFDRSA